MKKNDTIHGFTVCEIYDLPPLLAQGIWLKHHCGMEVFHLLNDDEENLFGFAFATPPCDSSGVAHILEHSVLCGSKHYPLKDPFVQLANQSVKTFLNAMTFPDKTIYPASSLVEADYFNVMAVYGDAVFFPTLDPKTFEQEAHRFEYDENNTPSIQGVVYNEMKGNYSSFESIVADWTIRAVLEGTPYEFDSGGDPECIPDLTYEQFVRFHAEKYAPSQCKLFLCGNIPTEKQLAFIAEHFLDHYTFSPVLTTDSINLAMPFDTPRTISVAAPSSNSSEETGSTVLLNWALGDSTHPVAAMEAAFMSEILLGHDGAPLIHALLSSGLGEDISPNTGLESELRQLVFSVGLRGVDKNRSSEIETCIISTLEELCTTGIAQDDIEAAFMSLDFVNREIRRSSAPFSLTLMRRCLKGWLHGTAPNITLLYEDALECVKERVRTDNKYIVKLIQTLLLNNTHRTLLTVYPDNTYEDRIQKKYNERIAQFEKNTSNADKALLRTKQEELHQYQQKPEAPEQIALIPHLKPSDLSLTVEPIETLIHKINNTFVFTHMQGTNGIGYIELGVPLDILNAEELLYMPFLETVLPALGFSFQGNTLNWKEASALIAKTTGGFGANLFTGSYAHPEHADAQYSPEKPYTARSWMFMRTKMLEEKIPEAVALLFASLHSADFSDFKRLQDLAREFRNDFEASIVPAGNQYAASRAACHFSRAKALDELWSGISQLYTAQQIATTDPEKLSHTLNSIRNKLIKAGAVVNITGTQSVLDSFQRILPAYLVSCAPLAKPNDTTAEQIISLCHPAKTLEVYTAPMQVGFAASVMRASPYGTKEAAHEGVFGHWLSNSLLWERIRTIGGAYGAFAYPDSLEGVFTLATYRDPNPYESLATLRACVAEAAASTLDQETLERAVTGTYSKEIQPRSPSSKGFTGFIRTLYGISSQDRHTKMYHIINTTAEDIRKSAERLCASYEDAYSTIIQAKAVDGADNHTLHI